MLVPHVSAQEYLCVIVVDHDFKYTSQLIEGCGSVWFEGISVEFALNLHTQIQKIKIKQKTIPWVYKTAR